MDAIIDGHVVRSESDFHNAWARIFDLEPYYGKNLDALRDSVSGGVERPIRLRWINSAESKEAMSGAFDAIVSILDEAMEHDERCGFAERFELSLE